MTAFLAIIKLTCKKVFRSAFFWGIVILLIATAFAMPLLVKSDGTAVSLIKLALEYSLTFTTLILAVSGVWLGASEITEDLENKCLQMVVVKPIPRYQIFLAKYTGVVLIHILLLIIASGIIYGVTHFQIAVTDFAPGEKEQLYNEILTARHIYRPDPIQKNIDQAVEEEIRKGLEQAKMQGKDMPEAWKTVRNKTGEFDEQEIRKRLRDRMLLEQTSIDPGNYKEWTYSGLPEDLDGPVLIRYKLITENSRNQQAKTYGAWGWRYYFLTPNDSDREKRTPLNVYLMPKHETKSQTVNLELITNQVTEFRVPSKDEVKNSAYSFARGFQRHGQNLVSLPAPIPGNEALMVKDGKARVRYLSLDRSGKTLYIANGGPELLVPASSGFTNNFCRTIPVLALLIMIVTAMGMAFSACLSLSTGLFLTAAYVLWGICSRFMLDIFTNTAVTPRGFFDKLIFYLGNVVDVILLNPEKFAAQEKLSSGELVEISYMLSLLLEVGKVLPIFLLGLLIYCRREIAMAGKER